MATTEGINLDSWKDLPDTGYFIIGQIRFNFFDSSTVGSLLRIREVENNTDQYVKVKPRYNTRAEAEKDMHLCIKYNRDRAYTKVFFWVAKLEKYQWIKQYCENSATNCGNMRFL